ncbi:hypothetical protein Hanom_Chr09g00856761 [Helianthus anomalus]
MFDINRIYAFLKLVHRFLGENILQRSLFTLHVFLLPLFKRWYLLLFVNLLRYAFISI